MSGISTDTRRLVERFAREFDLGELTDAEIAEVSRSQAFARARLGYAIEDVARAVRDAAAEQVAIVRRFLGRRS